jgi:Sec-independent protein translocase protein TatA
MRRLQLMRMGFVGMIVVVMVVVFVVFGHDNSFSNLGVEN